MTSHKKVHKALSISIFFMHISNWCVPAYSWHQWIKSLKYFCPMRFGQKTRCKHWGTENCKENQIWMYFKLAQVLWTMSKWKENWILYILKKNHAQNKHSKLSMNVLGIQFDAQLFDYLATWLLLWCLMSVLYFFIESTFCSQSESSHLFFPHLKRPVFSSRRYN